MDTLGAVDALDLMERLEESRPEVIGPQWTVSLLGCRDAVGPPVVDVEAELLSRVEEQVLAGLCFSPPGDPPLLLNVLADPRSQPAEISFARSQVTRLIAQVAFK